MLVDQQPGNGRHAGQVNRTQSIVHQRQRSQKPDRAGVADRGQPQGPRNAETGRHAPQPHFLVEFDVPAGIDHIEPGHPEHHGSAEQQGRPGKNFPADRHPGGQWRQHQRRPQPEMGRRGETLRVAIGHQEQQHGHGGVEGEEIRHKQQRAGDKPDRTDDREPHDAADAQHAGRQMPHGGPRIQRIEPPVGQTVERHRRAAGEDHAHNDPDQFPPAKLSLFLPRHGRRQQRKRQCKQRMAEANHFEQLAEAREHRCGFSVVYDELRVMRKKGKGKKENNPRSISVGVHGEIVWTGFTGLTG